MLLGAWCARGREDVYTQDVHMCSGAHNSCSLRCCCSQLRRGLWGTRDTIVNDVPGGWQAGTRPCGGIMHDGQAGSSHCVLFGGRGGRGGEGLCWAARVIVVEGGEAQLCAPVGTADDAANIQLMHVLVERCTHNCVCMCKWFFWEQQGMPGSTDFKVHRGASCYHSPVGLHPVGIHTCCLL